MIRFGLAVATILALAVACSSGGDDAEPTAVGAKDDLARSMLLTVGDFPTGWAENPDASDDDTPSAIKKCTDSEKVSEGRIGYAVTGNFEKGSSGSVSQAIAIYETPEQLKVALSNSNSGVDCLVKAFNDGKIDDADAKYSDAKYAPVSFPTIGDSSSAIRMTIHVKSKKQTGLGSEGDIFFDIVYVSHGTTGFSLTAQDVFSPFDSSMLADLAKKADAKIK